MVDAALEELGWGWEGWPGWDSECGWELKGLGCEVEQKWAANNETWADEACSNLVYCGARMFREKD